MKRINKHFFFGIFLTALVSLFQSTAAMKEDNFSSFSSENDEYSDHSLPNSFEKLTLVNSEDYNSDSLSQIESTKTTLAYNDEKLIIECSQRDLNLEVIKKLLHNGANPNCTTNFYKITPMSYICAHEFPYNRYQKQIILELLKYGAHYIYKNNDNQPKNLLVFAIENA